MPTLNIKAVEPMDRISPEDLAKRIESEGIDLAHSSNHDPKVQQEVERFVERYRKLVSSSQSIWIKDNNSDRVTAILCSPDLSPTERVVHQVYGDPDSSNSLRFREELSLCFVMGGKREEMFISRFREGDHINSSGESFIALMRGEEGSIFYPERRLNSRELQKFF